MEPNVTLHWFVHPNWFQELGGFTKAENIEIFVEWCRSAFSLFGGFHAFTWTVNPDYKETPVSLCPLFSLYCHVLVLDASRYGSMMRACNTTLAYMQGSQYVSPATALSLGSRILMYAGKRSKHWTTFNEPTVAANCGWALGNHPPGKLLHFKVQTFLE